MSLSEWALLGFVVWTLLVLMGTIGITRVTKVIRREAAPNSFNPTVAHGTEFYQRCMRAHMNCIENLPLFGALVLLGNAHGLVGPYFQLAALAVLPARVGQTLAHISSGRNRAVLIRFYFYSVQLACFVIMAVVLALHGLAQRR